MCALNFYSLNCESTFEPLPSSLLFGLLGNIEQAEVEKSLHIYLVGEEPIAGLLMSDTGEKVSIYDAWRNGLIRRGIFRFLLLIS